MESTLSATNLFNSFKTLTSSTKPSISHLRLLRYEALLNEGLQKRFSFGKFTCVGSGDFHNSNEYISISSSANLLRSLHSMAPIWSPVPRCWTSAASFACGVGGGDGSNGGETKSESIGGQSEEILALSPDVVILDVEGMMCEGCTASVKRILESQPQVSSANVNLATNTAVVWPVSDTKDTHNWQQQLGDALAKHLTNCGFKSNPRGQGAIEGSTP